MRTGGVVAKVGWVATALVLVAGVAPLSASAADRLVLCEEFTATW